MKFEYALAISGQLALAAKFCEDVLVDKSGVKAHKGVRLGTIEKERALAKCTGRQQEIEEYV